MFLQLTLTTQANYASSGTSTEVLIFSLIIGIASILAGVGSLFILRSVLKQKFRKHVSLNMKTLLVRIPKEKAEKDKQEEVSIDGIRQDIAVAETLFATIGGLRAQRGFMTWLRGRTDHISFEMVMNKGLISFYIVVPNKLQQFLTQQILAQYPNAQIDETEDYNFFKKDSSIIGAYLVFKKHFSHTLKTYKELESDPLSGLTNPLSKLAKEEGAAIQFVIRSSKKKWRSQTSMISKKMQKGRYKGQKHAGLMGGGAGSSSAGNALGQALGTGQKDQQQQMQSTPDSFRMNATEEEIVKRIEAKSSKAGLDVNIRIVVATDNDTTARQHLDSLLNAFSQFNNYQYGNSFSALAPRGQGHLIEDFIYRAFHDNKTIILNTEEITSMWHLPLPSTETPNINWLSARKAPPPSNMPEEGLLLGKALYRNEKTPVRIKRGDRRRHMYIIGKSGSGKSVYMENMIIQDVKNGEGVCVLDPHGDLVMHVLANIPEERKDDVIIFNPSDMDRPVGLNMLEAKTEDQKDFVVQEMISIFYKLFGAEMIGPIFEHQMRNVMLTLMADIKEPGTIAEIPRMFSDDAFAQGWVKKVKDPVVRAFWEKEMAKTSDFHKSETLGYLISKVGRFVGNEMMRNIIGQNKSGFDFREIMDKKKILLINLAKGTTGEVNAKLLGLIIVAKLQMAALGRADISEDKRHDFYLYIDEFQNFITDSISTILSEARKYRLNLIMAHQYMGQLSDSTKGDSSVRDAVLGNAGTMCAFRIGPDDSEILAKEFAPVFNAYDLINVEKFTAYVKLLIDNTAAKPFNMATEPPLPENEEYAKSIIKLSRIKYGRDRKIVAEEVMDRSALGVSDTLGEAQPTEPTT